MVSQSTTAFLLAAVFVSAYGMPADSTLVSTPVKIGGAYPQASQTGTYDDKAPEAHYGLDKSDKVSPLAVYTPPPVDYGYGRDVDPSGYRPGRRHSRSPSRGRRGRSRSRSHYDSDSDCSEVSVRSESRDSYRSRRSDSCDSVDSYRSRRRYRSKSCDSRCSRSVSRDYRSESCDSRCDRSVSCGYRSDEDRFRYRRRRGGRRGGRRSRYGRRWGHGRRYHGFWRPVPMPYGPQPWGPHGWTPRPFGIRPFGPRPVRPRPYGVRPLGPRPWRPIRRPSYHYGGNDGSDCESPSYLQKRFYDESSGVDRVTGLPRIYGGGFAGRQGRRGQDQYRGGDSDNDDYYGGRDSYGVDTYGQNRRRAGGNDYGYGGDDYDAYGRGDYGRGDYERDYGRRGGRGDRGYGGRPASRPRGDYPVRGRSGRGHPTLNVDRRFSQNDYDANVNQRTVNVNDRRHGRMSLDERHADEQIYNRNGHERIMVDRYGQRATSRQEQIEAAQREADSRDLHISGPRGSLNHSQRSASEDTFNSDRSERTFHGPNRSATERSFSVSTSSRDFNSESTRIVGRPTQRF